MKWPSLPATSRSLARGALLLAAAAVACGNSEISTHHNLPASSDPSSEDIEGVDPTPEGAGGSPNEGNPDLSGGLEGTEEPDGPVNVPWTEPLPPSSALRKIKSTLTGLGPNDAELAAV